MISGLGGQLRKLDGPVLVTGHTGFKGTWLTLLLEQLGVPVVGLSLPPEDGSLYRRLNREGKIEETYADIRNFESVNRFMSEKQPAVVINMAAQPLVMKSYITPRETFETNVLGTVNVLDSSFATKSVKAIIAVTTDKVYRNDNSGTLFDENDPLAGKDPYSASKVGTESAIAAWQQIMKVQGGPPVVSVRAGNVIGGGDWAENRLLPDLIRGFISGKPIPIRNPDSTRPWQHVLDPLVGYLMGLESVLLGNELVAINFGPSEKSISVREVVEICALIWDKRGTIRFEYETNQNVIEAINLDLDSTLARSKLGWKPTWNQIESAISTTNWWKRVIYQEHSPEEACLYDIEKALSL
jgi:CDP-glucose 4,6-dehydratase